MKCSVGVAVIAVVVLLGSAAVIMFATGGMLVSMRMSTSALDPAALPPGTDVGLMRTIAMGGMAVFLSVGLFAAAAGVGLIRLWRWARYATIVLAAIVIFMSLTGAAGILLFTPPPGAMPSDGAELPAWFRAAFAAFYASFSVFAIAIIVALTRPRVAAQFNGEVVAPAVRVRPLSVTIIAWLMIVGAAITIPTVFLMNLPAAFLGLIMTGLMAKVYYAAFFTAELVIGLGLLKRTSESLMPAIVLHGLAVPNALIMLIPAVQTRYEAALATAMPFASGQPTPTWARPFGLAFAFVYTGVILYFLIAARRTMTPRSPAEPDVRS